jgi:hypothetical protein
MQHQSEVTLRTEGEIYNGRKDGALVILLY